MSFSIKIRPLKLQSSSSATNIQSAIRRALTLASRYRNVTLAPGVSEGANYTTTPAPVRPGAEPAQPVLVFLTDGMPTAGELRLNRILSVVKHSNQAARVSGRPRITLCCQKSNC